MVGGTTHQPQQASQLVAPPLSSSSSSTAPATTPEEDELLKRNTDCVYFLASPLTCKKGSECEYRHSDIARVNPRDCWYWLNGSCLNPKCGFRHPPLDGLLGADISTPVGPSVPPPHPAPYAVPKQGVACIFFQKGYCLKGHLCPFLHGPPNSVNNKAAQSGSANPISEPPKTAFSGPEKSFQDQKLTQPVTAQKPVEFLVPQAVRMQAPPLARNGGNGDKKAPPPSSSMGVEELPRYKSGRVVPPPVVNETPASKPNRGVYHHVSDNDRILNGKDADEYSREPSPGFDVLVDNELGDSEYYRNKDEFGRSRRNDYDLDRPTDYDVDREIYRDYDHYNERQGERYAWDERRSSSERMLDPSAHLERRSYPRNASPDHFDESDLRHRISKQRRVSDNGLRSVVSREGRTPRRDSHHHRHQDQGGLSSRLRGRIKIPGRSVSPTNGRPPLSVNHTRLWDRKKDTNNDPRDHKGFSRTPDNDSEFAGPKRLSELKKGYEQQPNDERQVLGKRKYPNEEDLSFEGPKPLSEILKSKRGSETARIKNKPDSYVNNTENNEKEREMVVAEKEENVSAIVEAEKEEKPVAAIVEAEKVRDSVSGIDEDALLDEELEGYEDREGEYEYVDGEEEYNMDDEEEGEYVDEEEEYGKKEESVVYL
ncbi:zinc finger CCCH domain-containing protein 17 [Cynara cardunculus var. scolymus]|uniref:Zinc finger, CCCH-type n=1 Tax=Cynara cardunculus var. scolymus TaxID=59895 RepID=A0A124SDP1_CYNCS|nr:zinc finger CCCH domain-containing protein 17 [Cynara cardunculus var. scolymus]KVH97555.1 Zinc finger, CCCH-type [Cynara cardunculus var. scolymus]